MDKEESKPTAVAEDLSDEERRKLLKPSVTVDMARKILQSLYADCDGGGDTVQIVSELESYDDVNFKVMWNDTPYLLKIHNGVESADFVKVYEAAGKQYNKAGYMNSVIHLQTAIMDLLSTNGIPTSGPVPTKNGMPVGVQELSVVSPTHSPQQLVIRLLTWVDGKLMSAVPFMPVETLADCGRLMGKVHSVFNMLDASSLQSINIYQDASSGMKRRASLVNVGEETKEDMVVTDKIRQAHLWKVPESGLDLSLLDAARRFHQWDGKNTSDLRPFCKYIDDEKRRALVLSIIDAFQQEIIDSNDATEFRIGVIHGDFNDANILLNDDLTANGVIDFGDSVER
jgi:Ser/Thr protein kinase RdoA (MazF antagonist)